jgi:hypothetical protein
MAFTAAWYNPGLNNFHFWCIPEAGKNDQIYLWLIFIIYVISKNIIEEIDVSKSNHRNV